MLIDDLITSFLASCPDEKCQRIAALTAIETDACQAFSDTPHRVPAVSAVGVPAAPPLVAPRLLKARRLSSKQGHAAFIHAICHIEFTAINLAIDAAMRFRHLPPAYYRDWIMVANDEALHFQMLNAHLKHLGFKYGDFPAHSGLWDVAEKTAHDVLSRMALVPRVMEAHGLDVTPGLIQRLESYGDSAGAEILRRIYRDEIQHVHTGTRWFNFVAAERGLHPADAFQLILSEEFGAIRNNSINYDARRQAGFSELELKRLAQES